jgi:hypothetical protein
MSLTIRTQKYSPNHSSWAARLEHALDFLETAQGIINGAEDQRDHDAVKGGISERKGFGGGLHEVNRHVRLLKVIVRIAQHGCIGLRCLNALDLHRIVVSAWGAVRHIHAGKQVLQRVHHLVRE